MTLRLKIILGMIITLVALIVIFSIIAVVGIFRKQGKVEPPQQQTQNSTVPSQQESQGNGATTPPQQEQGQSAPTPPSKPGDDLLSLVLPFVERFGSYSNQGNFENLSDLLPFMTDAMKTWAQKQITIQTQKSFQSVYRGVTTKALSYTMAHYDATKGQAEMKVSTQRQEMIGSSENSRSYTQDITVKLVKSDGVWLVDGVYWQ